MMKKIEAIIERLEDGTFSVNCRDEIFSGMGNTIEEAKKDMKEQMDFYKETAVAKGFKYPSFLDGEFEISYTVDPVSLLKYYVGSGVFSLAGMEKLTGINQKQLWSYLNGTRPRKAQAEKIENGFLFIVKDLSTIFVQ